MEGSSGGIGSLSLAVKYPDVFEAFASHSGDCGFEYSMIPKFPIFIQGIKAYDYKIENFIEDLQHVKKHDPVFRKMLLITAEAACYSPNPTIKPHGFELPFDPYTGKIRQDIWKKWLAFDPVRMVEDYLLNIKKLSCCYIDCGNQDQFNLHLGARQLHNIFTQHHIDHIYDPYDGDHFLLRHHQMTKSIPIIVNALVS